MLAVVNAGSSVGLQNKIGLPASCSLLQTSDAGSRMECPRNINKHQNRCTAFFQDFLPELPYSNPHFSTSPSETRCVNFPISSPQCFSFLLTASFPQSHPLLYCCFEDSVEFPHFQLVCITCICHAFYRIPTAIISPPPILHFCTVVSPSLLPFPILHFCTLSPYLLP